VILAAVPTLALAACGDDGGEDDGATLGDTVAPTEVTAPELPDASASGTGVVRVGGVSSSFAVIRCELEPDPAAPAAAQPLLLVTGEGTTAGGVPFQVEVQRFATGSDVQTFTDSVTYTDTAKIIQLQRVQVGGETTDLRDSDARGTLLQTRADGVAAAGIGGPPGSVEGEDAGLVGMAVDATC
jgi:hypothetical protein